MELADKVVFISGGGGGIGGGMAEAFAEKGAKLVLADIDPALAKVQAAQFGDKAMAVELDVTSSASWAAARAAAYTHFGTVDILCNNAGVSTPRMPLDEMPEEMFARVMAVNVTGVYNGIAAFAGDMCDRRSGHIVNTSSMNGLMAFATLGAYSASKFAVTGMSEALQGELAPFGVGVSIVFPGLTRSRMSMSSSLVASKEAIDVEAIRANMMEPIWLGRAVARAVERNELYVITHPAYRPVVEDRARRLIAAFGEPAQPGYRTGVSATAVPNARDDRAG